MFYHLRNTAYVESHTRGSTGHGFHKSVGEVIFERGCHEKVHSPIQLCHICGIGDVVHRVDRHRHPFCNILCHLPHNDQRHTSLPSLQTRTAQGGEEVVQTLAGIGDLLAHEEQKAQALRKCKSPTSFVLGAGTENVVVIGIRNAGDVEASQQPTLPSLVCNPLAAADERNAPLRIGGRLLIEDLPRQVMRRRIAQLRTVVAMGVEMSALASMVADGCCRPHIMHGPHHWFSAGKDAPQLTEGEEPLIDPMQMNDVCLTELRGIDHTSAPNP